MGFKILTLGGMIVYVRWVKDGKTSAAEYAFKLGSTGDKPIVGNQYKVSGENSGTIVVTRIGTARRNPRSGLLLGAKEDGTKFGITKQMVFNQTDSVAVASKYTTLTL